MRYAVIFILAVVILAFLVAGCFSSNPKDIQVYVKPSQVEVTTENYILRPPDEIEIHCSKIPEIHLQHQRIRPDGKVSFEGLGEIFVAGKTVGEVTNLLKQNAAKLYTLVGDNPIDVRVVIFHSQAYYVLGQVRYPGVKVCTGRDSAFSALAAAEPLVFAWQSRIQVVRPSSEDGSIKPKIFEINFDRMSAHGDFSKNVLLRDGDIVFVPPTVLAAAGMKVEEFVGPIGRVLSASYMYQQSQGRGYQGD